MSDSILSQISALEEELLDVDKTDDLKYATEGDELKKRWKKKALTDESIISAFKDLIEEAKDPQKAKNKRNAIQKELNAKPVSELTVEQLEDRILFYGNEDLQETFFELKKKLKFNKITADAYKIKLIELAEEASPHDFGLGPAGGAGSAVRHRKRKQRKTQKRKNRRNRTRKN